MHSLVWRLTVRSTWLIIDREAREIIRLIASVCPSVDALTSELFGLWPWFLAWRLTLTLAGLGLKVKVVGQCSRSNNKKKLLHYIVVCCRTWGSNYGCSSWQVQVRVVTIPTETLPTWTVLVHLLPTWVCLKQWLWQKPLKCDRIPLAWTVTIFSQHIDMFYDIHCIFVARVSGTFTWLHHLITS